MDIKKFFQRKQQGGEQQGQGEAQPLRIEGVAPAPMTPEPDDAELAAQALLENLMQRHAPGRKGGARKGSHQNESPNQQEENRPRDAAYYRHLSQKIRQAREAQRLRVVRFLAFCEQELKNPHLPAYGPGSLGLLEAELYKRMDIVDREGGDLKRRWQHCLANVTVRLMQHSEAEKEAAANDTE